MEWQRSPDNDDLWFCQMTSELALVVHYSPTYSDDSPIEDFHWVYGVADAPDGPVHRLYISGRVPTAEIAKQCALASYEAGPRSDHDKFDEALKDFQTYLERRGGTSSIHQSGEGPPHQVR